MIEIEQREDQLEEQTFGYLHVRHEFTNVILHVGADDGDFTRTENSGLTPEDQDSLKQQTHSRKDHVDQPVWFGCAPL